MGKRTGLLLTNSGLMRSKVDQRYVFDWIGNMLSKSDEFSSFA